MIKIINQDMIEAVMRKKGELNLSLTDLSKETGVSRFTLSALFKKQRERMRKSTRDKLESWLFKHI